MSIRWLLMASHVPADGQLGGMVRYTVELAQALSMNPEIDLHILSRAAAKPFWSQLVTDDNVHTMRDVPTPAQSWLERNGRGSGAFAERFDVIQGTKHIIPKRNNAQTLALTVHDFLPLDRPADFGFLKRQLLPGPYLASAAEADALICVSAATRDRLLSYLPQVADRAHVVPLANESIGLAKATPHAVAELVDQDFALVVGDPSPRKNLEFVMDLWQEIGEQYPNAQLAVVGPPDWKQNREGSSTRPSPNIHLLGRIDDDQLRWCYERARVVLCPSLLEGFGLPSVEGLRARTPVITSADPAMCEATGTSAIHISTLNRREWESAIVNAFQIPTEIEPPASRTWYDVASETVAAVQNTKVVPANAS